MNTKHPGQTTNLPVQLRMQWLGVAVSIQKKNELLNKRCAELQDLLMNEGFKTSILKGQGVATLYRAVENADLCSLRQSGDIDIYVEGGIEKDLVRKELARVRATAMEGSFGTQKEHYDLRRVKARTKRTEILYIFFGIHAANVVQLADRIEQRARLTAA